MAIVAGTEYQQLLSAVADYYGSGSDQWLQIAQYGTNAPDFLKIMKQVPNYNVVVSQSGKVLGYERFDAINTSSVASQINSNVQSGAYNAVKVRTPATTGTDSVTGKVTAEKGIPTTGGTQFITKSVVPAIAAAGVGIKLGKTIDSALYNANPDFWDAHGMSSLDPNTWNSITADMSDTVGEGALATAFNMLFGIDPNTGKSQAYIDQNAFAYLALYEQQRGMFDYFQTSSVSDTTGLPYLANGAWLQPVYLNKSVAFSAPSGDQIRTVTFSCSAGFILLYKRSDNISYGGYYACASSGTSLHWVTDRTDGYHYETDLQTSRFSYNNRQFYAVALPEVFNLNYLTSGMETYWTTWNASNPTEMMWVGLFGDTADHSMTGTGNQAGATLPQLNNDMSVADVLSALQTQYPDLFQNAINYPVLQPDGTTENYVYIPIALPSATSATDTRPTGDGQYINQTDYGYDPSTMPDTVWDFIVDYIMDTSEHDDDRPTDDTGDGDTPTPVLPTGSASALWKIYNPSQSQLDAFGAWLWSSDFVDQILKLFNDPMQAIIGLHKVFVTPPTSGSGAIKVGYLTSSASANYVSGQYVDVDCGSITLEEYFGNVFDYENTSVSIYLPFSGIHKLNIDDVMRGAIGVKYHVDVLTGACLIEVSVVRDGAGGVLYTFSGNCAVQYPVSSGSYVGIVTGLLGIAGGVAGSIATGGALAPMLMGAGASVGRMHTDIQHSGNISSNAGAMGIKKPYLIIERSQTKTPKSAVNIEGLPQNLPITLSTLHGYVKVKKAHYDGIPCTSAELEKIKALLENGVYIP